MEAERLVPDLFLFLRKALYEEKTSGLQLSFNIFDSPQLGVQQKQPVKKFWQLIQRYAQF